MATYERKHIDIGANLLDDMFQGSYHGKQYHPGDLRDVLVRASAVGMPRLIATAGCLEETEGLIKMCNLQRVDETTKDIPMDIYTTAGVHPTRCSGLAESGDIPKLADIIAKYGAQNLAGGCCCDVDAPVTYPVVAIGEFGIDYERLFFCNEEDQNKGFEGQLTGLGKECGGTLPLPLFLHYRGNEENGASKAFFDIMERNRGMWIEKKGVVHSYTGTAEDAQRILALGLDIGINGHSLQTQENLDLVRTLPADRLHIETDAPWCEMKPTHMSWQHLQKALSRKDISFPPKDVVRPKVVKKDKYVKGAMVKGRNEPCTVDDVLLVMAEIRGEDPDTLARTMFQNSMKMYFPWIH